MPLAVLPPAVLTLCFWRGFSSKENTYSLSLLIFQDSWYILEIVEVPFPPFCEASLGRPCTLRTALTCVRTRILQRPAGPAACVRFAVSLRLDGLTVVKGIPTLCVVCQAGV